MSKPAHYIISGGGSGGHIFPAIAIANTIKSREPNADILFVGALGKMEMEKVPQAGYPIVGLPIAGLQRGKIVVNLSLPFKLLYSLFFSFYLIIKHKPVAAIGVGGYASGPLLFAAAMLRVPTIIQEQNAVAGLTNRILARFVSVICVAYDELITIYKGRNVVVTGNPIRKSILNDLPSKQSALAIFGLDSTKKTILLIGGSLGAATLNKALKENIDAFIANDWQLIWQTGKVYFEKYKDLAPQNDTIKIVQFIDNMPAAYAAADIVISRAGALSIAELQVVGKPTIFVPSPNVTDDQQTKNVLALTAKNAAVYLNDKEVSSLLFTTVKELMLYSDRATEMAQNLKSMSIADADERIVDEIFEIRKL
jgi:UDP-N-acetylglucosamine--N-acetylmuramyl-(pentapeptide) pyrophosphoryl-undecaprenol N-acetylglucosamine transferase